VTTLRAMRWWDVATVMPLEAALFGADPWTEEGFWSELAGVPETRWYVVAEEAGDLVGYAGLFATRHEADVQTVAVAPGAQGRGIGALLVRALLDEAGRRGARTVSLEVRAENAGAQRLYERAGFGTVARRKGYYGPGLDAVIMQRRAPA